MIRKLVSRALATLVLGWLAAAALAESRADIPPSLRAAVEKTRYGIEPVGNSGAPVAYRAANPGQGLSVAFEPSGLRVSSGSASATSWQLRMNLTGWGYGKQIGSVSSARLAVSEDRIEYRRGPLTEWYVNNRRGLEQGFTLQRPPFGRRGGDLVLSLALSGDLTLSLAGEGQELLIAASSGEPALRFAGLKAVDAAGRSLPARMELRGSVLALRVDDTAATYPVTVDPLLTGVTKLKAKDATLRDWFGWSVALDGDTAVVGAPAGGVYRSGSAYVFVRGADGWSQQQKLKASQPATGDDFGVSVAISGDTVLVGASSSGTGGSAYVFVRTGSTWSLQQRLTANDAGLFDSFGWSVALAGDTALVGAVGAEEHSLTGAAYVFVRNGGVWSQQQKLTASDRAPGDIFGFSVALSGGGNTAVIGSPGDTSGQSSGSAYVFLRTGGIWSQQQKLTASDASAGDRFGYSVAAAADTAVIGAVCDGDAGECSGSAYVFLQDGGVWSQQQKLTASDAAPFGLFGTSVAVGGNTALIGAYGDSNGSPFTGAAYLFVNSAGVWSQQQKLTANDAAAFDSFGESVALSGGNALIGAPAPSTIPASGSAYVFEPGPMVRLWVGLKNSDNVGIRFDLLARVFVNGSLVGSGQREGVSGGSSGFNNAALHSIPLTLPASLAVSPGDTLSIDLLVRNACSGSGRNSGTARLWYNGVAVDFGPARDAGTRFDATIGTTTSIYFLRESFTLSTTAGASRLSIDKSVGARCGPFVSFGSWSLSFAQ